MNSKNNLRAKGITLIEILVATTIITVCFIPILSVFSLSNRISTSGKNLNVAVRLANSLMSGINTLDPDSLPQILKVADIDLPSEISLDTLDVTTVPVGFERFVSIKKKKDPVSEASFQEIFIDVEWNSSVSKQTKVNFKLSTVVKCSNST